LTEYLTNYMDYIQKRLADCGNIDELEEIFSEHMHKIAFMQHERAIHFQVTFMFAVILSIFMCGVVFSQNLALLILVTIILVLEVFYIKHYYFLENTVQKMYVIYDEMILKRKELKS